MKEIKDISKVIELFDKYGLTEFSYKDGDMEITLSKETIMNTSSEVTYSQAIPYREDPVITKTEPEKTSADNKTSFKEIKSPINGNFYRAPSPDSKPFIEIGDNVREGQVVCIVESMKLMNEIKSDVSGKIVDISVDNGQPVVKGQTLFLVE